MNTVAANRILPTVDERVRALLSGEKPVTVWEVAAKLGADYIKQVSAVLNRLTTEGSLASFRAGFNDYYALPRVALTTKEPTLITIISDSLKSLFLGCRYQVMGKLKG